MYKKGCSTEQPFLYLVQKPLRYMNTKQTLLENIRVTQSIEQMINRVDFHHLEKYITHLFSDFVGNRDIETVKYDLNYDVQTPTDTFLSDLMEIGSVQLLKENGLLRHEDFIDALYVIISAINIVVADFLQEHRIADVASYRYLDADPQYVLLERAVEHVGFAVKNEQYLSDLVNNLREAVSSSAVF